MGWNTRADSLAITPDPSILGQRVRFTAALRVGSHLALGLSALERRRSRVWIAATAAAIGVDRAIVRSIQRRPGARSSWHGVVDTLDAALWSLSGGDSPTTARHVYVADGVAGALEAGYLLGVGNSGIPMVDGVVASPPLLTTPATRWLRAAARAVLPILGPVLVQRLIRSRRQQRLTFLDELYGPISLGMGFLFARTRHHLQVEATLRWEARADYQASVERQAIRASLYTRNSDAHSFRKNLVPLYVAGSQEAAARLAEAQALPMLVLASKLGTTLHETVLGVPLEPPSSGTTWLSTSQRDDVRQFLDSAENVPLSDDANVRVIQEQNGVRLSYLGHERSFPAEPPRLVGNIDPVPAALAMAALWKMLAMADYLGGIAPSMAVGTSLLDGAAVASYYAQPERRTDDPPMAVLVLSALSSIVFSGAVARGRGRSRLPDGTAIFPATGAINGSLLFLVRYWNALPWSKRGLVVGPVVASWLAATLLPARPSFFELLIEVINPLQTCLATYGIGERILGEADLLERTLQERFSAQVLAERQRQANEFLAYYEEMVRIVEEEMVRIVERELERLRSLVPDDIARSINEECAAMHRWLAESRADAGWSWL